MVRYKIDYHTHCHASFDSEATIEDMVVSAIGRGFSEICITDHWDIMIQTPSTQIFDFEQRDIELEKIKRKYQDAIILKKGMEFGQPFKNDIQVKEILEKADGNLDFIIGSIHNLYGDEDVAFTDFYNTDLRKLYDDYIDKLILMVEKYEFDILGHITYPSRYMFEKANIHYDLSPHMDRFEDLFKKTIHCGKGIEINTSGYFRGLEKLMPDRELLKLYKECGGELITVGSDAHRPEHVGGGFEQAIQALFDCDFAYYTVYEKRKAEQIKLV